MNSPVVSALAPVVLLIAIGFFAGRRGWVGPAGVKDLSALVFLVLTPALLFRTMSTVHIEQLDFRPVASYFVAVALIFVSTLLLRGFNRRAAVLGLANTFSNTVAIGVPLVSLAYGEAGLVVLFTLISVHSLVLLTAATIVLELAVLREQGASGRHAPRPMGRTVLLAMRNSIIHPVPLPIIAGLFFGSTGAVMPAVIDKPLQLLGSALGPLALLAVGATLAAIRVGPLWRGALGLALVKNVVHPAAVAGVAWLFGLRGTGLGVMVLAAALPIGANVFLFSQRYQVAEDLITAGVAVSTVLALATISLVMLFLA
jgi:predicted permease